MKVCWNLTNECNSNCIHCFRNIEETSLTFEENKNIIENIDGSVDFISFSGGEALLYDRFFDLVKQAKKKGIGCSLTTNAKLLNEDNIPKLIEYLDRITFSIEEVDDRLNAVMGRGHEYCSHLKKVILFIRKLNPEFFIKVNTVVTKQNINRIKDIYDFLIDLNVNTWVIKRFCPYRQIAKANENSLIISNEEFNNLINKVSKYELINTIVEDYSKVEEQLVITSSGNLIIGRNHEDVVLLPKIHLQDKESVKLVINQNDIKREKTDINLNLYKTFYIVAKAGSISAASKQTYISQPAISKAVKKIETDLNVKLFERSINGTKLTKQGEKLLYYVEAAYNNLITAERSLKEDDSFTKGSLKIGVPSHIGTFFLFEKVKEFKKMFPNINIFIISRSTKELLERLNKHEIDFIIDSAPIETNDKNLTIVPLSKVKHCFVCSKECKNFYEDIHNIYDIQNKPLILPAPKSTHRKNLDMLFESLGIYPNDILTIETSEMILNAIKENLGIGYILYELVEKEIKDGGLVLVDTKIELPEIEIDLVYNNDYLTSVPRYFIKEYMINE